MDSDELEDEGPLDADLDEFGHEGPSDTVPCDACGREVYADADRCPACGQYLVQRPGTSRARRWWWILLALAGVAMVFHLATC